MHKKAQTNKIFVYLLSIIMIAFVGFLVTKFIVGISSDVETRIDSKIYKDLEFHYKEVYNTWGSEEVKNYKVSNEIKIACFVNDGENCNINQNEINFDEENFNITIGNGHNIVFFDENGIAGSKKFDEINVENNCLCIEPIQGRFSLIFQNRQNKVWILENK